MIQSDPHGNMRKCGQPYPQLGVADGIAFSCSNTGVLQPSLRYMFNEINKTIYGGTTLCTDVDLRRWSNQGVLMLNTSLTTQVEKIGQHYDIWKGFVSYLFDYLDHNKKDLVYLYMGKKAQEWADFVGDNNHKIFTSHPASAAYNKQKEWNSDNAFLKAQYAVAERTGFIISWQYGRYIFKIYWRGYNAKQLLYITLYKEQYDTMLLCK